MELTSSLSKFITEFNYIYNNAKRQEYESLSRYCFEFNKLWLKLDSKKEDIDQVINFDINKPTQYFKQFECLFNNETNQQVELNVWKESGLKRDEVRNTAVLAWWLDCKGSHGLGSKLLVAFLSLVPEGSIKLSNRNVGNGYNTKAESLPLGALENRIDIEIMQTDAFLLFIEVKIDAPEGKEQLKRYQELLLEKAQYNHIERYGIVYLTKYSKPTNYEDVISLSWKDVAQAFRNTHINNESLFTKQLLIQFCDFIEEF